MFRPHHKIDRIATLQTIIAARYQQFAPTPDGCHMECAAAGMQILQALPRARRSRLNAHSGKKQLSPLHLIPLQHPVIAHELHNLIGHKRLRIHQLPHPGTLEPCRQLRLQIVGASHTCDRAPRTENRSQLTGHHIRIAHRRDGHKKVALRYSGPPQVGHTGGIAVKGHQIERRVNILKILAVGAHQHHIAMLLREHLGQMRAGVAASCYYDIHFFSKCSNLCNPRQKDAADCRKLIQ